MKKREIKRRSKRGLVADLKDELNTLEIRMNELEGLGRCIEGELAMLREMIEENHDDSDSFS